MKRIKFLIVSLMLVLSPLVSMQTVYAASISLDPSTGTIDGSGRSIDIIIDSGGVEVNGVEMSIEYAGEIAFTGFESGNIAGCTVDGLERDTEEFDDVFLYCFILTAPYTGTSGVFATLNFEATGDGYAGVRVLNVVGLDGTGHEVLASYTTTSGTQQTTPTQETETTILPQTSVFNIFGIAIGTLLLSAPLVLKARKSSNKSGFMRRRIG